MSQLLHRFTTPLIQQPSLIQPLLQRLMPHRATLTSVRRAILRILHIPFILRR